MHLVFKLLICIILFFLLLSQKYFLKYLLDLVFSFKNFISIQGFLLDFFRLCSCQLHLIFFLKFALHQDKTPFLALFYFQLFV